jgi:lipoprotein signal peptidase
LATFVLLAAGGLAADLLTKHYVFASFLDAPDVTARVEEIRTAFQAEIGRPPEAREVLHHFQRDVVPGVRFTLSLNPGVVFGLPMPRWAVAIATVLTMGLVTVFFATAGARERLVHVAMAFVLAGAVGNLYDRLASVVALPDLEPIRYHVRDFIDCSQLHYPWVFNVADVLLVVGVALLMLHWIVTARREAKARRADA